MNLFVMLTRLTPRAVTDKESYRALEARVKESIAKHCNGVRWQRNLALMGPYDYLDIFEAPSLEEAMKVSAILRSDGQAQVEIWPAEEWDRFKGLLEDVE